MINVIPTDIYDKDGNLSHIEFNDSDGNFVIKADWDPTDEQTSENRIKFRKWAYNMIKRLGYEVAT